jgi:hypothetical protein
MKSVTEKIQRLYGIVSELEQMFPGRKFTPDGHLVGSIGEVYAAEIYGLKLYGTGAETHDAVSGCKKQVQIKTTQGSKIGIGSKPEHLLVIAIAKDGSFSEIYNGPGELVWNAAGAMQKNGQRPISTNKLKQLMGSVHKANRILASGS